MQEFQVNLIRLFVTIGGNINKCPRWSYMLLENYFKWVEHEYAFITIILFIYLYSQSSCISLLKKNSLSTYLVICWILKASS
jgi:hypothetical protein